MSDNGPPWMEHRDELFERVVRRGRARKRRRALVVTTAVVAVLLAVAGGLYLPAHRTRSLHVADPDRGTTTTVHPAQPAGVLLIGDSVMLGARTAIEHAVPGARVDAAASRQFEGAISMLSTAKRRGLPQTVVIHLGNNGPMPGDAFDQVSHSFKSIMDVVGPETPVFFVSVKAPRAWEVSLNDALYSEVVLFPNAHVLAWQDVSRSHPDWFLSDGFHLSRLGASGYAAFLRDGIRPLSTTYSDPFAGRAIPSTGFVVTDDGKPGRHSPGMRPGEQGPTSFAMEIFDDAGTKLGDLPRGTIRTDASNASRHTLVVTDNGIRIEPRPLDRGRDIPAGCTQTDTSQVLTVGLCGRRSGDQLLGDRIVVNQGSGWSELLAAPPVPTGNQLAGHWNWAAPSPDGRWVLADWSAECEVVTSLLVSVADGSVRAVTGEAGAAWRSAPQSGAFGWSSDGSAMVAFGGEAACGTSAPVQRGIYLVSPESGTRRLLLALTPSQGSLRWSAVEDQRTRPTTARELSFRVDLDGDGRVDRLRIALDAAFIHAPSRMTAVLADGRVVSGTFPGGYAMRILGAGDIAGDGRHEVFVSNGGETWTTGEIVVLDGARLVAKPGVGDDLILGWGVHSNSNPRGTADVACRVVDGRPSLVITDSSLDSRLVRHWHRAVYTLDGATLVLRHRDSGALPTSSVPPPDLPLANRLDCGSAKA